MAKFSSPPYSKTIADTASKCTTSLKPRASLQPYLRKFNGAHHQNEKRGAKAPWALNRGSAGAFFLAGALERARLYSSVFRNARKSPIWFGSKRNSGMVG